MWCNKNQRLSPCKSKYPRRSILRIPTLLAAANISEGKLVPRARVSLITSSNLKMGLNSSSSWSSPSSLLSFPKPVENLLAPLLPPKALISCQKRCCPSQSPVISFCSVFFFLFFFKLPLLRLSSSVLVQMLNSRPPSSSTMAFLLHSLFIIIFFFTQPTLPQFLRNRASMGCPSLGSSPVFVI